MYITLFVENDDDLHNDELIIAELNDFLTEFDHINDEELVECNTGRVPPPRRNRPQDRSIFKPIDQYWDYNNPCQFCGNIYLISTPIKTRHLCCMNGAALTENYPQLKPLPPQLKNICLTYLKHMSAKCTFYNNILSIGKTSVSNGRTNRYEQINAPHSVKLNGRVIHTFPKTNRPTDHRGLAYFTYDFAEQKLSDHVDYVNRNLTNIGNRIEKDYLKIIFNEMKENNIYAKQVTFFNI
jgi:hypothetical protein